MTVLHILYIIFYTIFNTTGMSHLKRKKQYFTEYHSISHITPIIYFSQITVKMYVINNFY